MNDRVFDLNNVRTIKPAMPACCRAFIVDQFVENEQHFARLTPAGIWAAMPVIVALGNAGEGEAAAAFVKLLEGAAKRKKTFTYLSTSASATTRLRLPWATLLQMLDNFEYDGTFMEVILKSIVTIGSRQEAGDVKRRCPCEISAVLRLNPQQKGGGSGSLHQDILQVLTSEEDIYTPAYLCHYPIPATQHRPQGYGMALILVEPSTGSSHCIEFKMGEEPVALEKDKMKNLSLFATVMSRIEAVVKSTSTLQLMARKRRWVTHRGVVRGWLKRAKAAHEWSTRVMAPLASKDSLVQAEVRFSHLSYMDERNSRGGDNVLQFSS